MQPEVPALVLLDGLVVVLGGLDYLALLEGEVHIIGIAGRVDDDGLDLSLLGILRLVLLVAGGEAEAESSDC